AARLKKKNDAPFRVRRSQVLIEPGKPGASRRLVTTVAAIAVAAEATAATTEATATAAATEATAAAATAEGATSALFLGTSLIHGEGAATEIGAVHLLGGQLGLLGGAHGDEGEATGAASHLVHGDVNVGNAAELAESRTE